VGLLLAYGGLLALLAAALARLRSLTGGRERDLAVALVAGAVAWVVHGLFDWDWNIPAVTAPALAMLGLVAALPDRRRVPRPAAGALALAGVTLAVAAAVVSAALPAFADSKADAAAEAAARGTPAALQDAAALADLAARLDPLSTRPLFVAAAVAQGRGRLLDARSALLRAAERQPDDPAVWLRLAGIALKLADREGFARATQRALALDPANPAAILLAARAVSSTAPPASSATATGTPLPLP
jgi:tetratricopeptide (TPR) repeat protein